MTLENFIKWETNFSGKIAEDKINKNFLESIPQRQHDSIEASRKNIEPQFLLYENDDF